MAGGPRFTHLDDLTWQEVRRQQKGDRTVSVWEKWPEYSDNYLSVYARYREDPNWKEQYPFPRHFGPAVD